MKLLENRFIVFAAAFIIVLLYFFFDARTHIFPQCPFYTLTHFYCPGCGSQRAFSALVHGQIATAIHNNLLLVASLPLFTYTGYLFAFKKNREQMLFVYKPWFAYTVLAAVLSFWLLRNIPFYPFVLLAPLA